MEARKASVEQWVWDWELIVDSQPEVPSRMPTVFHMLFTFTISFGDSIGLLAKCSALEPGMGGTVASAVWELLAVK